MSRPTLQALVDSYLTVGIPPARAISYIVDSRMRSQLMHGRGNHAARRLARLQAIRSPDRPNTLSADPTSLICERLTESRTFNRSPRPNFHE